MLEVLKATWIMIKVSLMVIGAMTVLCVALLLVGFYMLTRPSGMMAEMEHVEVSQEAAESFDQKFEELEVELDEAEPGEEVSIALTQEEVTSKMDEMIDEAGLPMDIDNLVVNFKDDEIWVVGQVDTGLTDVSTGMKVDVVVNDQGEPVFQVGEVDIGGGVPVPSQVEEQIMQLVPTDDVLTEGMDDLPIEVESITMENGEIVFSGVKE
ncbi:MAG: hypothetical protein SVY53_03335 [Chloroflexota bacterium]|nr:hypothetical protein [Chloroflexota bacterium]